MCINWIRWFKIYLNSIDKSNRFEQVLPRMWGGRGVSCILQERCRAA